MTCRLPKPVLTCGTPCSPRGLNLERTCCRYAPWTCTDGPITGGVYYVSKQRHQNLDAAGFLLGQPNLVMMLTGLRRSVDLILVLVGQFFEFSNLHLEFLQESREFLRGTLVRSLTVVIPQSPKGVTQGTNGFLVPLLVKQGDL